MNDHKFSGVKSAWLALAPVGQLAVGGLLALGVLLAPVGLVWAQGRAALPRRAEPPKFDRAETQGVFFDNLFGQQGPLVGTRPASATAPLVARSPAGGAGQAPTAGGPSSTPA
ncbi:MAG: hypothetical protein J5I93_19575, partial [Pirellulaceae bacterium]|nr:hypothetical protein [Pirellulaceae bacterium]